MADFKENWDLHVEVERLRACNAALVEALEDVEWWLSTVSNSRQYFRAKLRAVLAAAKGEK